MIGLSLKNTFTTSSGLSLRIRPIQAGDEPLLIHVFQHLSSDSIYMRFHEPLKAASSTKIKALAADIVDKSLHDGFGLLAFVDLEDDGEVPIGGARYVRLDERTAEAAVTVRDDMQGHGVGSLLLSLLVEQARREGIEKLVAVVQAQNRAVLKLLRKAPFPFNHNLEGSELYIEVDISKEQSK